jgi:hypothetical protein
MKEEDKSLKKKKKLQNEHSTDTNDYVDGYNLDEVFDQ